MRKEGQTFTSYSDFLAFSGLDPALQSALAEKHEGLRKLCSGEIRRMKAIILRHKSRPPYRVYGGAIKIKDGFYYHSTSRQTLVESLREILSGGDGFVASAFSILVAYPEALIPIEVSEFTPVVTVTEAKSLPRKSDPVQLYLLTRKLTDKATRNGNCSYADISFLIAEATSEAASDPVPRLQLAKPLDKLCDTVIL